MTTATKLQLLESVFTHAPCNEYFQCRFKVEEGYGEVTLDVRPDMLQGGRVVHGSFYFKILDDAATIASMSLLDQEATVTSSFNTYFMRSVAAGTLTAKGYVIKKGRRQIIAEAVAYDENGREVARGSGVFVPVPMNK